jgi:dethiobiotin synthetase
MEITKLTYKPNMIKNNIIFITGIGTDVGKTYVTGLLARYLQKQGHSVITQKIAQTGCTDKSEDILKHREIMGISPLPEDNTGQTCPYIFEPPMSPHLAAKLAGTEIDCGKINAATDELAEKYDFVIVEGVGGLYVPLNDNTTVIDLIAERNYPVILVSSPALGSINHTLMSIELLKQRNITMLGIAYNLHYSDNPEITADSKNIFENSLKEHNYQPVIIDIPAIPDKITLDIDFSLFFQNFEAFCGSWTENDAEEFDSNISDMNKINKEDWE